MNAVYLFTGENAYLLRQERQRWVDEFVKKHGSENYARVDGEQVTLRGLLEDVSVLPFLAQRRLVVIDSVPDFSREHMDTLLASIHPQVIVVFSDAKPDKRLNGVKRLLQEATVKTFQPLKGKACLDWMNAYAVSCHTRIDDAAKKKLIEFVGEDMDIIAAEIDKLALRRRDSAITAHDVEVLVIPSDEGVVWTMTDLLSARKKQDALRYVHRMIERGAEEYKLWSLLLSHLKNAVLVRAALDASISSPADIVKKTEMHPYAVRQLLPYAKSVSTDSLKSFLAWVAQSDKDLKTGTYKSTDESPQELYALIDMFIMRFP